MSEIASGSYVVVGAVADFECGELRAIEVDEQAVVIANIDGTIFALDGVCSHREGPLAEGILEGFEVTCPYHFARFDVRSGEVKSGPACENVRAFPVRIVEGRVEILIARS